MSTLVPDIDLGFQKAAPRSLARAGELLGSVGIADVPGRGAPGTGDVDWPAFLRVLAASGYRGPVALEVVDRRPDSAASLAFIREVDAAL